MSMMSVPPPSPTLMRTTMPHTYSDTETSTPEQTFYKISLNVPIGTRVVYEKWCSPEFFNQVLKGSYPRLKGVTVENIINPRFSHVFEKLEELYADKLWEALKKRGKAGVLHFNFNREDFSRTGIGPPRLVCNMFLNELTKDGPNTFCKRSNGKFHGMHFDVWGNRAFTTHFTW